MASKRILLVEDDPNVGPLLQHVLLSAGYSVDVAATALQASWLVEMNSYDLVVADAVLPDGNGVLIADKAKALNMKAVIITGYALHIPREELGRHDYILKPVRPQEVLAAVAAYLGPAARKEPGLFTVLFVEDDWAVRDVVIRALSEKGFGVLTAGDGFEALRVLAERPADLLFADIVMPGMDGVELAERAKLVRPGLKVLFVTGYPQRAAERDATSHGRILYKPLREAELLREVEGALAA
jgi:two-component system, cell cycle response regulator CpdR